MASAETTYYLMDIAHFLAETGEAEMVAPEQVKPLQDGTYVMAKRLLFHWTLIRGAQDDYISYFDRWCFVDRALAMQALADFPLDPAPGYEPVGWHRHPDTGRRRPDGDVTKEYIEH